MIENRVRRPFWLIAKDRPGGMEVLSIVLASGEVALPVFSFEDEAMMFLELGALGGWRARETADGELVSVLCGPCADARKIVLDPLHHPDAKDLSDHLSMEREAFVEPLLGTQRLQAFGSGGSTVRRRDGVTVPAALASRRTYVRTGSIGGGSRAYCRKAGVGGRERAKSVRLSGRADTYGRGKR
jgi:hypothetical protein